MKSTDVSACRYERRAVSRISLRRSARHNHLHHPSSIFLQSDASVRVVGYDEVVVLAEREVARCFVSSITGHGTKGRSRARRYVQRYCQMASPSDHV
jgi:hypothetical protein